MIKIDDVIEEMLNNVENIIPTPPSTPIITETKDENNIYKEIMLNNEELYECQPFNNNEQLYEFQQFNNNEQLYEFQQFNNNEQYIFFEPNIQQPPQSNDVQEGYVNNSKKLFELYCDFEKLNYMYWLNNDEESNVSFISFVNNLK